MKLKIIRKEQQQTSNWSGGTTTQLAIFPENASYENKTFSFRLSSAKVDIEESTFTKLEGVSRDIMILDGELELIHEGRYSKKLKQFDTDQFQGDWNTKSQGKVTDFNLMTTGKNKGFISHIKLPKDNTLNLSKNIHNVIALYPFKGGINITFNNEIVNLKEKDIALLFINKSNKLEITSLNITSTENSDLIISKIYCANL